MKIDFDYRVLILDYVIDNDITQLKLSLPDTVYSRSSAIRWFREFVFGVELSHEPFITKQCSPQNVNNHIKAQLVYQGKEPYIDDFGFYVYYQLRTEIGLKDNRYDTIIQ
jgi:hypothetical protein